MRVRERKKENKSKASAKPDARQGSVVLQPPDVPNRRSRKNRPASAWARARFRRWKKRMER
jgi:hypothetical protein